MVSYTNDYLLDKRVKIFQPTDGVFLSSLLDSKKIKKGDTILDVGSGTGAISLCLATRLKDVKITGVDIQKDLVELSNKSAKENSYDDFLTYVKI